jgi:hypothetical protein
MAVYDIVEGERTGAGHEAEGFLLKGSDMTVRVKMVQDNLTHALGVFGQDSEYQVLTSV